MPRKTIDTQILQSVLDYLKVRPWEEVSGLIGNIMGDIQDYVEPKKEAKNGK